MCICGPRINEIVYTPPGWEHCAGASFWPSWFSRWLLVNTFFGPRPRRSSSAPFPDQNIKGEEGGYYSAASEGTRLRRLRRSPSLTCGVSFCIDVVILNFVLLLVKLIFSENVDSVSISSWGPRGRWQWTPETKSSNEASFKSCLLPDGPTYLLFHSFCKCVPPKNRLFLFVYYLW